jgi:hypothetical protein
MDSILLRNLIIYQHPVVPLGVYFFIIFFFYFGATAPILALAYLHETLRFISVY